MRVSQYRNFSKKYIVKFYECSVKKQLKVFDFKSQVLNALSFLDPVKSVSMPTSVLWKTFRFSLTRYFLAGAP